MPATLFLHYCISLYRYCSCVHTSASQTVCGLSFRAPKALHWDGLITTELVSLMVTWNLCGWLECSSKSLSFSKKSICMVRSKGKDSSWCLHQWNYKRVRNVQNHVHFHSWCPDTLHIMKRHKSWDGGKTDDVRVFQSWPVVCKKD